MLDSTLNKKGLLTTGDVAKVTRTSIQTVIRWFETGLLRGYKVPGKGGFRRFRKIDVRQFMEANDMPWWDELK